MDGLILKIHRVDTSKSTTHSPTDAADYLAAVVPSWADCTQLVSAYNEGHPLVWAMWWRHVGCGHVKPPVCVVCMCVGVGMCVCVVCGYVWCVCVCVCVCV